MQGSDILSTPMLLQVENRESVVKLGKQEDLRNWALTIFASILGRRTSLSSSDCSHPLFFPLHLGLLEGQPSSRTFQSNPIGIDLEVLAPTFSTGELNGGGMVSGLPVMDKRAITLDVILFLLCLIAVVKNGLITAELGMQWLLWRILSPWDKLLISLEPLGSVCNGNGCWSVREFVVFLYPKSFLYNPVLQFLAFHWDFLNDAYLMVFLLAQCFLSCENCNPHSPCLPLPKAEGVWVGLLSSVGFFSLNAILFFISNEGIYRNYLRRGLQSWNATGNSIRRIFEKF